MKDKYNWYGVLVTIIRRYRINGVEYCDLAPVIEWPCYFYPAKYKVPIYFLKPVPDARFPNRKFREAVPYIDSVVKSY